MTTIDRITELKNRIKEAKEATGPELAKRRRAKPTRQAMRDIEGVLGEALAIFKAEVLLEKIEQYQRDIKSLECMIDQDIDSAEMRLDDVAYSQMARALENGPAVGARGAARVVTP